MRKLLKLTCLIAALAIFPGLQSCKKEKNVLDYVPSDAPLVGYIDLNYLVDNSGITSDGKIKEPLKGILEQYEADLSDMKEELVVANEFTRKAAFFISGNDLWIVAAMNDSRKLIDYLESKKGFEITEGKGVTIAQKNGYGDTLMFKDDILFIYFTAVGMDGPLSNVEGVNRLCDLGDNAFSRDNTTKEIAGELSKDDVSFSFLGSISKLSALTRSSEFESARAALTMICDNPSYMALTLSLNDEGASATYCVLNNQYKPAKASLTFGEIDIDALGRAAVPNNCIAAAAALPAEFIDQIISGIGIFFPSEAHPILRCINGTAALTINPNADAPTNAWALMVTAANNSDAVTLGEFARDIESGIGCSTNGNYLRITPGFTTKPSGDVSYAKVLKDKAAGVVVDINKLASVLGASSLIPQLGTLTCCLEVADGSPVCKLEWKCKDPIDKILTIIKDYPAIESALRTTGTSYGHDDDYVVAYDIYDSAYYEEEPANADTAVWAY